MGVDAGDLDAGDLDAGDLDAGDLDAGDLDAPRPAPTAAARPAVTPAATAGPAGLGSVVARVVESLERGGPHRPPTAAEAAAVSVLIAALTSPMRDSLVSAARPLGLSPVPLDDPRHLVLASDPDDERSWLLVALEPEVVPTVVVEVPHPHADLHTEVVGLGVARAVPGALYLQAGAHRVAGAPPGARRREDCPADVAVRADAVFSLVADGLVARLGLPQVQVHGFADRPDRAFDVVVSPGAAAPGPLLDAVVAAVAATGERVRTPEVPGCADLAGRRNVQGLSAARYGSAFVHLELSRSLRRDRSRTAAVARAVGDALLDTGAGMGTEGRRGDGGRRGPA